MFNKIFNAIKNKNAQRFLTPILVTGSGRNGSTLIMQLLRSSKSIFAGEHPPFEDRYLSYLLHWAKLTSKAQEASDEWKNTHLDKSEINELRPMPLIRSIIAKDERFWKKCFMAAWAEFPRTIKKSVRGYGEKLTHYAEKSPPWIKKELQTIMPCKSIYPLRDPRDVWLSANAFNDHRGYYAFGRKPDDTLMDYAEWFTDGQKKKLIANSKVKDDSNNITIYYEKLITNFSDESKRLSNWLGIQLQPKIVLKNVKNFQDHITSANVETSVHRWKRELEPKMNQFFLDKLGPELELHGYET